ncbi:M24 family metallopeptidase [Sporomusa malonica]|uniref:Xaa-Pro aminopeptidase n=1 Tax=Sporomusa malonica TaxID=112901 RepID=A0A1W2AFY5_9FIRM|nr:Xaa-Pro peptidase family protein [Sporomusa malonica]SMC59158.1 Xaa-Pro aminopeptidase [Sporomusa malonica]
MIQQRLARLHELMTEIHLDGIVITKPENRQYFSGFAGSSGMLVISRQSRKLLTDFRYIEQAKQQAPLYQVVRHGNAIYESLAGAVKELGLVRIGFESDFVTWEVYQKLADSLNGADLIPVKLDTLRMVKDPQELVVLTKAVEIADSAFNQVIKILKPGLTELELALELEYQMRKLGAEKTAFDTIVASGVRGALPHGKASNKVIEVGDFVTMDFGAVYQGYHSDMTRTVVIGKANDKQRTIYNIVLSAQLAGVNAVKAGKRGKEVDQIARQVITDAGYGEYFGHGLGHGVGLFIHEDPRLSPAGDIELAEGMVVSVEPGIYLPGWGGVRIEDLVVVSAAGCTILTTSSKDLIEIG